MENIGSIKFSRSPGSDITRVAFEMPILISNVDGLIHLKLPLLGDMETVATSEEDIDIALSELSNCFMEAAERFGKGVIGELKSLGWSGTRNSVRFKLNDRDRRPLFNHMIRKDAKTTQRSFSIEYAE